MACYLYYPYLGPVFSTIRYFFSFLTISASSYASLSWFIIHCLSMYFTCFNQFPLDILLYSVVLYQFSKLFSISIESDYLEILYLQQKVFWRFLYTVGAVYMVFQLKINALREKVCYGHVTYYFLHTQHIVISKWG